MAGLAGGSWGGGVWRACGALPSRPQRRMLTCRRRGHLRVCRAGGRWVEDEGYTATLGAGWQLEAVREACYRALALVGKDAMHFR